MSAVPSAKVLLVDDDPVILKLLQVNFEMEGYKVTTANDGVEGLKWALIIALVLVVVSAFSGYSYRGRRL